MRSWIFCQIKRLCVGKNPRRVLSLCLFTILPFYFLTFLLLSCSVSYKFNGASIDYNKTKTIQIAEFPIRSAYVWAPMGPMFNNELKEQFASHTRLSQVRRNGDLKIEGEITQYQQRNKSVSAEGYSAQTELSITSSATSRCRLRAILLSQNSR